MTRRLRTALFLLLTCGAITGVFAAEKESASEWAKKGSAAFFAGKIKESIAAFERAAELRPDAKPQLWQLGISYYYADRFADGRDLFELHQTVNPEDVENSVWHFLCVSRLDGLEAARKKLIPITQDRRVPMKQIHALFAGSGTADEVIAAAKAVSNEAERKNALCYAHLYLGLYEEARGNKEKSTEHIQKAANDFRQRHYMGEVARVHWVLRSSAGEKPGRNPDSR